MGVRDGRERRGYRYSEDADPDRESEPAAEGQANRRVRDGYVRPGDEHDECETRLREEGEDPVTRMHPAKPADADHDADGQLADDHGEAEATRSRQQRSDEAERDDAGQAEQGHDGRRPFRRESGVASCGSLG